MKQQDLNHQLKSIYRTLNLDWSDHCEAIDRLRSRLNHHKKRHTLTPAIDSTIILNHSNHLEINQTQTEPQSQPQPQQQQQQPQQITNQSTSLLSRNTRRNAPSTTFGVGDAVTDAQFENVLVHLGTEDQKDPIIRAFKTNAKIPDMFINPKIEFNQVQTLIKDPISFYNLNQHVHESSNWSKEEIQSFELAYSLQPKQFGYIASCIKTKNRSDCVKFYYQTKSKLKYRNLLFNEPIKFNQPSQQPQQPIKGKRNRKSGIKPSITAQLNDHQSSIPNPIISIQQPSPRVNLNQKELSKARTNSNLQNLLQPEVEEQQQEEEEIINDEIGNISIESSSLPLINDQQDQENLQINRDPSQKLQQLSPNSSLHSLTSPIDHQKPTPLSLSIETRLSTTLESNQVTLPNHLTSQSQSPIHSRHKRKLDELDHYSKIGINKKSNSSKGKQMIGEVELPEILNPKIINTTRTEEDRNGNQNQNKNEVVNHHQASFLPHPSTSFMKAFTSTNREDARLLHNHHQIAEEEEESQQIEDSQQMNELKPISTTNLSTRPSCMHIQNLLNDEEPTYNTTLDPSSWFDDDQHEPKKFTPLMIDHHTWSPTPTPTNDERFADPPSPPIQAHHQVILPYQPPPLLHHHYSHQHPSLPSAFVSLPHSLPLPDPYPHHQQQQQTFGSSRPHHASFSSSSTNTYHPFR